MTTLKWVLLIHSNGSEMEPNPFQSVTILSRMFNGRREPNPFQYVTNPSIMFNWGGNQTHSNT